MLKFLRSQSPITLAVEILFAALLLAAFWISQDQLFRARGQSVTAPAVIAPSAPVIESTQERDAVSMAGEGAADPRVQSPSPIEQEPTPQQPASSDSEADPEEAEDEVTCAEAIQNGGFESFGAWTIPITDRPGAYSNDRAAAGEQSLKLGLEPSDENLYSDSTVLQYVDLPHDATQIHLRAQVWRRSSGSDSDFQYLIINNGSRSITVFREKVDDPSWQAITFDLTPFAGQRIRLLFGAFNNGEGGSAAMWVDEVSVQVCRPVDAGTATPPPAEPTLLQIAAQPFPMAEGLLAIYLPRIHLQNRSDDSTQPPAQTPTPEPQACEEVFTNGGFEEFGGWIMPLTASPGSYTDERVFRGARSARVGIPEGSPNVRTDSTIYRYVDLPGAVESITLRAQVWRAGTPDERDFHYLWISSGGRTQRIFQDLSDARQWQQVETDLTPLAGQRILLFFGTFNTGTGDNAYMYIDDVSIAACARGETPATPTPIPTPTVTPTPTSTPNHAPMAEMSSPDYGVNVFLWWRPEIAERDLGLVGEAGFRWVRQSFAWEDIEQGQGSFEWTRADRVVRQVNEAGVNLLARLGTDPDLDDFWAGEPPASLDDFVAFVAAVAQRYNCTPDAVGCIQAYQIWNEPNLAREWGGQRPNPAQYVDMLGEVYAAIKDANPNAIVISAGMAPTGTDNEIAMPDTRFYREMYRAMGGDSEGYLDLLGVHAAGFAAPPELSPAEVAADPDLGGERFFAFRHVEDVRAIMEAFGDEETRIAILEFGWTSDPYNPDYAWFGEDAGIDEFVKADYLVRAYQWAEENWQPWIGLMSVLTMPNLDWLADGNPYDEEQYWWAILEPSEIDELRLRPAYVALCDYLNEQRGETCPYDPAGE